MRFAGHFGLKTSASRNQSFSWEKIYVFVLKITGILISFNNTHNQRAKTLFYILFISIQPKSYLCAINSIIS